MGSRWPVPALIGSTTAAHQRGRTAGNSRRGFDLTIQGAPPDAAHLGRLTRGVNLSHWFAQGPVDPGHFETYITSADLHRLKHLGFRHVRLGLDPVVLSYGNDLKTLSPQSLRYLDGALGRILRNDLAVIVDLHPGEDFKRRLAGEAALVATLASAWEALARRLSSRDPALVFLEVLNEPGFSSPADWAAVQQHLLEAMRRGAPDHTLVAAGHAWSAVDHLVALAPVPDTNVVYNFHFYEPHAFTHQGAIWAGEPVRRLRDLPYPSSPDALAPVLAQITSKLAMDYVRRYGQERWDRAKLEARLSRAVDWARRHNVRLICNEFGVYRPFAPPASRHAWIRDVRTILERFGIGWSLWDYAGDFGLVISRGNERVLDKETLQALGLEEGTAPAK